jgi:lysozyme
MASKIEHPKTKSPPPQQSGWGDYNGKEPFYAIRRKDGSYERRLTRRGGRMFLALVGSTILAASLAIANSSDGPALASTNSPVAATSANQTPVMAKTPPGEPAPTETTPIETEPEPVLPDNPIEKKLVSEFDQEELAADIARFASEFEGLNEKHAEALPDGTVLYTAYADPGYKEALPTICYGHTKNVKMGQKATLAECQAFREQDVNELVLPYLNRIQTKLTENQAIAFGDAIFNLGGGILNADRTLGGFIRNGDIDNAIDSLDLYVYSNGTKFAGLERRRNAEQELARSILGSDEAIGMALANNRA